MDSFVFAQVGMAFEALAADVTKQGGFSRMNSDVFSQFVGTQELFKAIMTLVCTFAKMTFSMIT